MKASINEVKSKIKEGKFEESFADLISLVDYELSFVEQGKMSRLLRKIPLQQFDLKTLKIAFLATSTVDHLAEILQLYLAREGFNAKFYIAEYDTIYQTALDPDSELYSFQPDIVWVFTNHRDLGLKASNSLSKSEAKECVADAIDRVKSICAVIHSKCDAQIIINNADRPLERSFGNFDVRVPSSKSSLIHRFNLEITSSLAPGIHIFDFGYIADSFGLSRWHDEAYWYHSKHAFSFNAIGSIAHSASMLIRGIFGRSYKCLVLDLDNTLWGGVIGDDGIEGIRLGQGSAEGEAFQAFQHYIKELKDRGIILAACSKNEHETAAEAVQNHPEMVLKLDDFAVFTCNWHNKADNIRAIASTLDIGLDSLVFVDDNPVERAQVKTELPVVAVPDMPQDPVQYLRTLDQQLYFETAMFSEEDINRSEMYRVNAERKTSQTQFSNIGDFLRDLSMKAQVGGFDQINLPRVAQLINKSNQFHLTTTRYSEKQILSMISREAYEGLWVKLNDRFGDNGLISAVLLHQINDTLVVDTWVMSCRVLSRGLEDYIHNEIVKIGKQRGVKVIEGQYIPTKKNKLVAELYNKLGWEELPRETSTRTWQLPIEDAVYRENYIESIF
ncbi:MAG: HAD-IIIC family phosphatase [Rhodospirillales bacterium]|nr:HAD-IIIC family phosphatase [Rhodospirillales bacterium]